jgi:tetratricopeptide (TPR) repeat protein
MLAKSSLLAVFFFVAIFAVEVSAQQSSLVFTLPSGPYSVGFKSVNQYDYSRSFAESDLLGRVVNEGGYRPIQTSIWYPAVKDENVPPMRFEEYAYLIANEVSFQESNEETRTQAKKSLMAFCSTPESRFTNEMNAPTNAFRDLNSAEGSFPVIIYAPSFNAQSFENSVLCEYLASYGYIVVSSPCMGMWSREMTQDMTGIEAQARDIEFLISFAHDLPHADMSRLSVMGFSWGGISNVLVKMRNDNVKAVICLDGSIRYFPKLFKTSPFADSSKMDVPFLYLASKDGTREELSGDSNIVSGNFFNSLRYCDAYLYTFHLLWHQNFASNYIKLKEHGPNANDEGTQEEVNQGYEFACRYVLYFLNAYMNDDKQALAFLQSRPEQNGVPAHQITKRAKVGLKKPPSLQEFALLLKQSGFDKASQVYAEVKKSSPDFTLKEEQVNAWGYALMWRGSLREAIEVFKLNAELYPQSFNVWDSLAEAYMNIGEIKAAIANYQKSVELNPKNENGVKMIKKLQEQK